MAHASTALRQQRLGGHKAVGWGENISCTGATHFGLSSSGHSASQFARFDLCVWAKGKKLGYDSGGAGLEGIGQFLVLCGVLGAIKQHINHFEVNAVGIKARQQSGYALTRPWPRA